MADLPKTIKIHELPEVSQINDDDIFIIEDKQSTNKISYSSLIERIKTNKKISDYYVHQSTVGSANGVAELDENGKVPSSQLPSFVDDIIEGYLSNGKFYKEPIFETEITGETGKIYTELNTNKTYRWSGSQFVVVSETIALGETSTTAYRGDRGKVAYDHSQTIHARTDATKVEKSSNNGNIKINGTDTNVYTHPSGTNPHGTTKSDVGLGNVPNVVTNDQTPSYTEATTLAKLTSGEKISIAFGKISKAITDLISHIGNSNVHVTKEEKKLWNDTASSGTGISSLADLGVTATATELNYVDGVTSNIQGQLNGKASTSHGTHVSYGTSATSLGTSSAGSASTVSRSDHVHPLPALTSCTGVLSIAKGGTGATSLADAKTALGVTYGTTAGTVCQGNDSRLSDTRNPKAHNQSASTITSGTFASTSVIAATGTDYTTNRIRNTVFTTTDPGSGASTTYANGSIICVYE